MDVYLPLENIPAQVVRNNFVTISLNQADSLLFLNWERQINLQERKSGFLQALDLTHEYQIKNWLISDLNIYHISLEEKEWILTDWVVLASNSSILRLAVVCSENYNLLVNGNDFTHNGQKQYQQKGKIEHLVFTDFTSAQTWLLSGYGF